MMTQAATPKTDAKAKPALLFVDDERRVLTSMRAMFRREYEVLLANSGSEAVDMLAERDDVSVVVSDQRMPGMTGVELLAAVKKDYPSSMRILLTGYADLDAVEASINESEVFRYLMKPCPTDELKDAVRLAVQAARVSELAGVDELTALPEDDLEKIELTDVVEERIEEQVEAREVELELADAADGFDVEYMESAASFDEFRAAEVLACDAGADATREEIAGETAVDSALDPVLEDTVSDAQQILSEDDADVFEAATDVPLERPDPEVLVLTRDAELLEGVNLAIGPQYAVREADSVDSALRKLSEYPIGVLITDLAVNQTEIDELTKILKHEVPELVTIIASERSDAALLIGLINHGQIFRFLLKPLQVAQTRIWLNSAMTKYAELCADANTLLRHRVERNTEVEAANSGLFANVRARIETLKKRFASSLLTGLTGTRDE